MPTSGNGKVCYIEIPATNIPRSVDFYRNVFDWNRHAIEGDGKAGTGYSAYYNLVLGNGGLHLRDPVAQRLAQRERVGVMPG